LFISKNVYGINNSIQYSLPLGIEYEKLERRLLHKNKRPTNLTLTPGVSNKINNQSMINFEEPNTKPAYPQETIPYSQGVIWE